MLKFKALFQLTLITVFLIACESENDGIATFPKQFEVSDEEIISDSGDIIVHIDDVSSNIRVDEKTEFGASGNFINAERSPDGRYLAFTTSGTAHAAGWILSAESGNIYPAAFQYGGSVETGPWSDDSRYALFYAETPAPSRVITLTDLKSIGATVEDNSIPVRLPEHQESVPPNTEYVLIGWENGELMVEADGAEHNFVPGDQ